MASLDAGACFTELAELDSEELVEALLDEPAEEALESEDESLREVSLLPGISEG